MNEPNSISPVPILTNKKQTEYFRVTMTDYLNWADLKSLFIGIIGGFSVLGIARFWSNYSIKSMKRRIEQNEAYKENVNNLAKSDRALLITGSKVFSPYWVLWRLYFSCRLFSQVYAPVGWEMSGTCYLCFRGSCLACSALASF